MAMKSSRWTCKQPAGRLIGVGLDVEQVRRFRRIVAEPGHPMPFIFAADELYFCRALADPAAGLCASFCCKEAFFKALGKPFNFPECQLRSSGRHSTLRVRLSAALKAQSGVTHAIAQVLPVGPRLSEIAVTVHLFG